MLNIIALIKKNHVYRTLKKGNTVNVYKRNIPLNKEWYNSVYSFSNNPIRLYPAIKNFVLKLLKTHFNMYNKNLEGKYLKTKRSLLNSKVWVSTPDIKHYNNKLIFTFYVYNALYRLCKRQLNSLEFKWGPIIVNKKNRLLYSYEYNLSKLIKVNRKAQILRQKFPIYIGKNKEINIKNQSFYKKAIRWLKLDKFLKTEQYKSNIIKLINENNNTKILDGLNLIKSQRHNYLINQFKKELIYLKLKQKILFNKFKFNEIYLATLRNFLQDIYKKRVEFNIVMLKHHYISSSILTEMTKAGVEDLKNRGNAEKPMTHAIENNYIPLLSSNKIQREKKMFEQVKNIIYNKTRDDSDVYDTLNRFLLTNKKSKIWSSKYIDSFAMQNIENKNVAGIFLEIKGRLTRRFKAQRSIKVLRYKGTRKNIYSAYKGYSSVLSRGYANINVDKTIVNSKVRIGAYGLTGWVASY